jgi:GT2 family glycosyltransferase/glycosyltransferase involved in cell wall biosynthesis
MPESDSSSPGESPQSPADRAYVEYLQKKLEEARGQAQTHKAQLEVAVEQWSTAYRWCEVARHYLGVLRTTKGWRLLRSLRQVKAQLIDGRQGGRAEFFNGAWRALSGTHPLGDRFDPFVEVDRLPYPQPPDALERLRPKGRTRKGEDGPKHSAAVEPKLSVPKPSVLLHDGIDGSGACDIIIPVRGALHWVRQCLFAVFSTTAADEVGRVIVVDDGTPQEEQTKLEEIVKEFPAVFAVRSGGPGGFAGACHTGVELSRAPHLLFLNSDCLLTPGVVRALTEAVQQDSTIGLACALSNNAANVSVPLVPGESYLDVARMLSSGDINGTAPDEVCTVVGHCLLVTRNCWNATGGFDRSWGLGYGEESDLHLRARDQGYRGVVVPSAYVYHFGGGTFRYQESRAELQQRNYERFQAQWGEKYSTLLAQCRAKDPIAKVEATLAGARSRTVSPDVLFVLPGLSQSVGGTQVVVDIAHRLTREGLDAKILILGTADRKQLYDFQEPLFAHPLLVDTEEAFLANPVLTPRTVVSTLYKTVPACHRFARARSVPHVHFMQGYECLFEHGIFYDEVSALYKVADRTIVTSEWLRTRLEVHAVTHQVTKLPLGVHSAIFFPGSDAFTRRNERPRIGMVLRHGPDKGQAMLRELLARAHASGVKADWTVFAGDEYSLTSSESLRVIRTPIDRYGLARELRALDVFVDASLHEGFGMLPLEAMSCGAAVIASDSGGVREFIEDGISGVLIREVNAPEIFLAHIEALISSPDRLLEFRHSAVRTASRFTEDVCFTRYSHYFQALLEHERR